MKAIRSIVAATDLSVPARHAAERAARLARANSASLALVHAVSDSALDELRRWLGDGEGAGQALLDDAAQRLRELAAELARRHQIPVEADLGTGNVVSEIARHAVQRQADLVVTGTRGADFVRHLLLGCTAERLVKKATLPVLLVRQTPREPYRRVLVPVDFSPWSGAAIEMARRVAPGAHLVLLHALQVPFRGKLRLAGVEEERIGAYRRMARLQAQQQLQALALQAGLTGGRWSMETPDAGSDAWMQVVRHEQEQDCDLIVIGKHGRNALEELLLGSTTRMVIAEAVGDVLVSTRSAAAA